MDLSLSAEFELTKISEQIRNTQDIEELRELAIQVVEVNFRLRQHVMDLIAIGWLPNHE